jgi:hypothetical protein
MPFLVKTLVRNYLNLLCLIILTSFDKLFNTASVIYQIIAVQDWIVQDSPVLKIIKNTIEVKDSVVKGFQLIIFFIKQDFTSTLLSNTIRSSCSYGTWR